MTGASAGPVGRRPASGSDTPLHVAEQGPAGAARVVLVHGAMDRSMTFVRVARKLPELRVVRYDRRGYGRSVAAEPAVGLDAHVDDLLDVLGDEPAAVVGHSYGGVVALVAAERRPDLVSAVGAFEAPMPWEPWWPVDTAGAAAARAASPEDAAEAFMRRLVGDRIWDRLPPATKAARRAEGPALRVDMTSLGATPAYDAGSLAVPVVCGCGDRSEAHLHRAAVELHARVPGARLVEIAGAGHGAHLTHAAEFADFVRMAASAGR